MSIMFAYASCVLMAGAILALWLPQPWRQPLWLWVFAAALLCALPAQLITPLGILWTLIALGLVSAIQYQPKLKSWLIVPTALYLFIFALELLPGFARVNLVAAVPLGESSLPYGLRIGLAKPIAGLLVLAWLAPRSRSSDELLRLIKAWPAWLFPALLTLLVAWLLGLSFDIKWLWWTPLFIVFNVLFTVLPEEAFFRTFLQQPLQSRFNNALWIVPLMGVLFALVHVIPTDVGTGRIFTVIFIAGIAYAWSFRVLQRIEAAVLTHIIVNAGHFVFFTYPLSFA